MYLCGSVCLVDRKAELDHAVDAGAEDVGVVQAEARGEQGGVEEQQDELLDRLIACVCLCPVPQLLQVSDAFYQQIRRKSLCGTLTMSQAP